LEIRDFMEAAKRLSLYVRRGRAGSICAISTPVMPIPGYGQAGPESEPEILRNGSSRPTNLIIFNEKDHNGAILQTIAETALSPTFAYIPISAKETKGLGAMRIERDTERFSTEELHLLDLVSNRIGVTIENAMLQDEVVRRSELPRKTNKKRSRRHHCHGRQLGNCYFQPGSRGDIRLFGADEVVGTKWMPESIYRSGCRRRSTQTGLSGGCRRNLSLDRN
jgi:GAF domain-containing protein